MPGIPRSRACVACKFRRIKCDQNWPVCSQCARKKYQCSGPASLTKFVHNNDHRVRCQTTNPRPALLSASDLVAGRLVHHFENSKERMVVLVEPFKHLPVQLAHSNCLRDAASLLCTIWDNYRRNQQQVSFSQMPSYWQVIQSLSRALESKRAYSVDTLASVIILQQSELFFDPGNMNYQHEKGILALLSKIGPPKPGDKFHARLGMVAYVCLVPHWVTSAVGNSVFDTPEWTEAFASSTAEYFNAENLKYLFEEGFQLYNALPASMPAIFHAIKAAYAFKHGLTSSKPPDITSLIQGLSLKAEQIFSNFINELGAHGYVREDEDMGSPFGVKYWISTPNGCEYILGLVTSRMIILLANLKWDSIHNNGINSMEIFTAMRETCLIVWKFIPFLNEHDLLTLPLPWTATSWTLGFANETEKYYILDVFLKLDTYQKVDCVGKKVPRSRASIENDMRKRAAFMSM